MPRIHLVAAVAVAAAVAVPSVAHGATIHQDGRTPHRMLTVSCSAVRRVELDLGDGPDVAVIATPREVEIEGGNGPDRYVALANDWPSRVDFDGGIGTDVANYGFATAGVDVSVDLSAADGRPGDGDRIRRNVESVLGSQCADVLTGSPHAEQVMGPDGDDRITGGAGEPDAVDLRGLGARLGCGRHRRRDLHRRVCRDRLLSSRSTGAMSRTCP